MLALKRIDVEYVTVDMPAQEQRSVAYAALNPQAMVPCLELADGRVVPQSLAIIHFLERLVPEPSIYPDDQVLRAQAEALAHFIGSETAPFQTRYVRRILKESFGLNDEQDQSWITLWIRRGLEHANILLAQRSRRTEFAFGDAPGIADIFLIPQLRNAERFGVPNADLLELHKLAETCQRHAAFAAAHPDNWL